MGRGTRWINQRFVARGCQWSTRSCYQRSAVVHDRFVLTLVWYVDIKSMNIQMTTYPVLIGGEIPLLEWSFASLAYLTWMSEIPWWVPMSQGLSRSYRRTSFWLKHCHSSWGLVKRSPRWWPPYKLTSSVTGKTFDQEWHCECRIRTWCQSWNLTQDIHIIPHIGMSCRCHRVHQTSQHASYQPNEMSLVGNAILLMNHVPDQPQDYYES